MILDAVPPIIWTAVTRPEWAFRISLSIVLIKQAKKYPIVFTFANRQEGIVHETVNKKQRHSMMECRCSIFQTSYCLSAQQMRYSIILLYRFLFAFILLLGNCTAVSLSQCCSNRTIHATLQILPNCKRFVNIPAHRVVKQAVFYRIQVRGILLLVLRHIPRNTRLKIYEFFAQRVAKPLISFLYKWEENQAR